MLPYHTVTAIYHTIPYHTWGIAKAGENHEIDGSPSCESHIPVIWELVHIMLYYDYYYILFARENSHTRQNTLIISMINDGGPEFPKIDGGSRLPALTIPLIHTISRAPDYITNRYGFPMQTTSCTWPYVVPIGEDPAAHTFTDLYHTIRSIPCHLALDAVRSVSENHHTTPFTEGCAGA